MSTRGLVAHELKACETTDPHTGGGGNHNEVMAFSAVLSVSVIFKGNTTSNEIHSVKWKVLK